MWKPISEAPKRREFIAMNADNPKYPPTFVRRCKLQPKSGCAFVGRNGVLYAGFTHFIELPPLATK